MEIEIIQEEAINTEKLSKNQNNKTNNQKNKEENPTKRGNINILYNCLLS